MIDSQNIHDALNLLPDDLIAPVEALRKKKPFPWKALTALVACLCLCVGLWHFLPNIAVDNLAGSMLENGSGLTGDMEFSTSSPHIHTFEVYEVGQDHITAVPVPKIELSDDICVQISVTTVTFENLETSPELNPGQHIRIYYEDNGGDGTTVSPYRIEIIKEAEK